MNINIKVVLIDDEEVFLSSLEIKLKKLFPNLYIAGMATNISEGAKLIDKTMPNIVFLDIHLPDGKGFEILEKTKYKNYSIIFTTSFSEYAVRAFEVSAIHYLLKPIETNKLSEAIARYQEKYQKEDLDKKLLILKESLLDRPMKIILPTSDGQQIHNISDIVRCEADSSYSRVFFNNGHCILISRPLQQLHRTLAELDFIRIHSKHLVNLKYIKKYYPGRNPHLLLVDNTELPIAQKQKEEFLSRLKDNVKVVQ